MNPKLLQNILTLSKKRIVFFHSVENVRNWYRGSETYYDGILDEMQEVKKELRERNHVYLEDELGDVLWNYCCLLASLEHDGRISSREAVLERCYRKLSERIGEEGDGGHDWEAVKAAQKEKLKQEHRSHYED